MNIKNANFVVTRPPKYDAKKTKIQIKSNLRV